MRSDFEDHMPMCRKLRRKTRAEAALKESEARWRGVTDSAHDAILIMDPRGEAIRAKCDSYLAKPVRKAKLLEELRKLTLIN
jgi:hypothetical protein